jgi:hypothetical protein
VKPDNPYRASEATFPPSSPGAATGIRKSWAVFFAFCIASLVVSAFTVVDPGGGLRYMMIVSTAVDLAGIYFLFGFVVRKPIPNMAIRLLVIILALLMFIRSIYVLYILAPNLLPWRGTPTQYEALAGMAVGVPFIFLLGLALWLYATKPQGQPAAAS